MKRREFTATPACEAWLSHLRQLGYRMRLFGKPAVGGEMALLREEEMFVVVWEPIPGMLPLDEQEPLSNPEHYGILLKSAYTRSPSNGEDRERCLPTGRSMGVAPTGPDTSGTVSRKADTALRKGTRDKSH